MTVKEIVKAWLIENKYDGLYQDDCGCFTEDMMPCDDCGVQRCVAGIKKVFQDEGELPHEGIGPKP